MSIHVFIYPLPVLGRLKKSGLDNLNEYGTTRFIVRLAMPFDYAVGSGVQGGRTVFIWDCRRSMLLRCGPGDVKTVLERNQKPPPLHVSGHAEVERLLRAKGLQKQLLYLWAKRIGDVIEIEYGLSLSCLYFRF